MLGWDVKLVLLNGVIKLAANWLFVYDVHNLELIAFIFFNHKNY